MNLHQFRFVREAVRQNFNLTSAAKALFTSQPGVSKAIIELEDELGVEIFRRHGKRIRSLTEPGKRILISIERILDEVETLRRVGKDFASQDQGNFVIATTHTQARYALPKVLTEFTKRFPKVRVSIQQGSPGQIAELLTMIVRTLPLQLKVLPIQQVCSRYPDTNGNTLSWCPSAIHCSIKQPSA